MTCRSLSFEREIWLRVGPFFDVWRVLIFAMGGEFGWKIYDAYEHGFWYPPTPRIEVKWLLPTQVETMEVNVGFSGKPEGR